MDKIKKQNLMVKIICVLLSFGLWLYVTNVENPARSYEVKDIPVELVNTDAIENAKFAIVDGQKFTVDLKVEGPSTEVSKVTPEDFKVVADMSKYALKAGENTIPVQIMSYPPNITIKNTGFLGIKIDLEEIVTKEFPITSNVKVSYKEGVYELDKKITPTTVKATGGKSKIDKIDRAVISGEEKDVSKNTENNYKVIFLDSDGNEVTGIQSDVSTAKLSINVVTGKKVAVNLKTSGQVPEGYELSGYDLQTKYVEISGDGSQNIESVDTEPLDISSFTQDTEQTVKLNLPQGITVIGGDSTVKVKLNIKKSDIVTKILSCAVKYNNLNDQFIINSPTEKVNVTLSGTQSNLDKISENEISASIDLSNITEEGTYTYKPDIVINNDNKNLTISSVDSVTIVVKKKAE